MEKIESLPSNKASFQKLLEFGKQILFICHSHNITPVVYGSLAYFAHTKDETLPVRDLDLLIPEAALPVLQKEFGRLKGVSCEQKPYPSIELFKGDLEVDLDSIEHFLGARHRDTVRAEIQGIKFHILNIDALIGIYQEALDNMPKIKKLGEKRKRYTKKLNNLKKVQSLAPGTLGTGES